MGSSLRRAWTPQEVQEHSATANESMPEARTVDRDPIAGLVGGVDLSAGEESYEEQTAMLTDTMIGDVPADPPAGADFRAGE